MNAHLPAHLDSMKAPPQRDAVHAAFLRASQDGKALTAESEWRRFLGELTSLKVCSSSKERRVLEEAWATCETPTAKRMTWTDFRNHVVAQFLDADDQSEQARDAVRRVRAAAKQLQALSLVDDAPLKGVGNYLRDVETPTRRWRPAKLWPKRRSKQTPRNWKRGEQKP